MWDWLMAALGAKYAGYEEAGKRWELLFLYRRLEGLVDAAYGIGERGRVKPLLKPIFGYSEKAKIVKIKPQR